MYERISVSCLIVSLLIGYTGRALASDWGYDQPAANDAPVPAMRATALPMTPQRKTVPPVAVPHKSSGPAAKPGAAPAKTAAIPAKTTVAPVKSLFAPTKNSAAYANSDAMVEACWAQLYELAARQKIDDDQRAELKLLLKDKLAAPTARQEVRSIVTFWPRLTDYLTAHPDQRDNYASLLRALLRYKARCLTAFGGDNAIAANEAAFISEVLGPQRLSVPATIPFSEEAVNAYADMACFIFEQRNPGKTVDAIDNRAVFATVVSEKFKNAPSKKDQEAMAAFDLSWAKFKIVWTQANETQRSALLESLMKSGAGAAWGKVHDPMLESVLNNWVVPQAKPAGADDKAMEPTPKASNALVSRHK